MASRRDWVSRMAALFTSADSRPSSASHVSNMRTTSASTAMSAWTAMARAPARLTSSTIRVAASALAR